MLTDFDNRPIHVGTRVRMWDADLEVPADVDSLFGVVTDLGEWDGDVDSEGRSIGISPRVSVRFDDGCTEEFVTSEWEGFGPYAGEEDLSGKVEELDVVGGGS